MGKWLYKLGIRSCICCKNIFPLTKEYFYIDKHRYTGFSYFCKKCAYQHTKKYRKKHNYVSNPKKYKENIIIIKETHAEILLYSKYNKHAEKSIVDIDDINKIKHIRWCLHDGYAYAERNKKTIFLHRLIKNDPQGLVVDHINNNKLDNRKNNLRAIPFKLNLLNRKNYILNGKNDIETLNRINTLLAKRNKIDKLIKDIRKR